MISNLFLNPIIAKIPLFVLGALLVISLLVYYFSAFSKIKLIRHFAVVCYIFYPLFLTLGQYAVWSGNQITATFLKLPLDPSVSAELYKKIPVIAQSKLGYFIYYSWGHFWMPSLISLAAAVIFWLLIKLINSVKKSIEKQDVELTFLLCLLLGWPKLLIFIPAATVVILFFIISRSYAKIVSPSKTLGYIMFTFVMLILIFGKSFFVHPQ